MTDKPEPDSVDSLACSVSPAAALGRVKGPPFAVFDEFGVGADDRVQEQLYAAYVEGRRQEEQLLSNVLPGSYYMDPPDGGNVPVLEQLCRMAQDAARYRWLRDHMWGQALSKVYALPILWGVDYPGEAGKHMDAAIDEALAVPVPPPAAPDGPINARPNEQSGNQEPHP